MILSKLRFLFINLISGLFLSGFVLPAAGQSPGKHKILTVPDSISKVKFYPFGGYLLDGKIPPPLKEFYSLNLERTKPDSSNNELEIVGAVETYNNENPEYRMEEVTLTDKLLNFKTEEINKTHYEFKGKYLQKGDFIRFYKIHTPVLKGTFTKYSDGQIVYSSEVVFYFKVWKAGPYYQPEK